MTILGDHGPGDKSNDSCLHNFGSSIAASPANCHRPSVNMSDDESSSSSDFATACRVSPAAKPAGLKRKASCTDADKRL